MIVDLLRNDLGRICSYGSVKVTHPRELEKLPTVWHTFAQVEGLLAQKNVEWAQVVRAICPGGSVTGAPKIRAMQVIEELEGVRRGWYCGNIGWIGPGGNGTLNIAIRTILMRGQQAQVWAGAGIVADSQEEAEYQETMTKARALLSALGLL
jgi:anthranilate/para-aminobenzoate synthase component I